MLPDERVTVGSRLGFIGLGYLGSRIARRLVTAGFPMVVYDLDRAKAVEFTVLGTEVAGHPGELASEVKWCCRVFQMNKPWKLPTWEQATF